MNPAQVITGPHRPPAARCCEYCGDLDHHTNHCPELPPGWFPARATRKARRRKPASPFHRAALAEPEPIHHPHHPE